MSEAPEIRFPGAARPERRRIVDAYGVGIATYEWGPADGPPLFCVHGGLDFAATYDLLAPRLAAAGWRVVSWDQRGHGDSDKVGLYSWEADLRDMHEVIASVEPADAVPIVGHS
jgi:pimeloyl-ACP methyl ester carboxylesterase